MEHRQFLEQAYRVLGERGKDYGGIEDNFGRIAAIASVLTGRAVTPFEVTQFHIATKLARSIESPGKADNWVDLINYAAFAGQFGAPADSTST